MKELAVAKRAAKEAGKILLSYMGKLEHVEYKGRRDPVSEADKASEKRVAEIIREAFPAHGFLAEEKTSWTGQGQKRPVDCGPAGRHGELCPRLPALLGLHRVREGRGNAGGRGIRPGAERTFFRSQRRRGFFEQHADTGIRD